MMKNWALLPVVFLFLSGCTLAAMKAQNVQMGKDIAVKEQSLYDIEQENMRLEQEQGLLAEKLSAGNVSLGELNNDLSLLIKQKESLLAKKKTAYQDIDSLQRQIKQLKAQQLELVRLSQQPDSVSEKKKRIEELKEEIRNYLKLGLKVDYRNTPEP